MRLLALALLAAPVATPAAVYPLDPAATAAIDEASSTLLLGSDAGVARAGAMFDALRTGRIDRAAFTANGNLCFTPTALADYRDSLAWLGAPTSFVETSSALRGGFTAAKYTVTYPGRTLTVGLRAEPGAGGRFEQFTVYLAE